VKVGTANGTTFYSDGNDALFGDLSNDWLVGGTGKTISTVDGVTISSTLMTTWKPTAARMTRRTRIRRTRIVRTAEPAEMSSSATPAVTV
jgi:hypothetical protein